MAGGIPNIHHRKSIRLKGYDYAQAGLYFITICVQNRAFLFGDIHNGEMILNDAGRMVGKWYDELENKFPDIRCQEMVVMPNHFHCIIENIGAVRADLRVCPDNNNERADLHVCPDNNNERADLHVCPDNNNERADLHVCPDANNIRADLRVCPDTNNIRADLRVCPDTNNAYTNPIKGEHMGSPLHRVVQWFKTMTTNEYIRGVKTLGWQPFNGKLWQRNYYEHIIRNEQSYQNISNYIINNPAKWQDDKFFIP
jgi:REP element-mobilizing transposase RayT